MVRLLYGEKRLRLFLTVSTEYRRVSVTDGQTDGQTDVSSSCHIIVLAVHTRRAVKMNKNVLADIAGIIS